MGEAVGDVACTPALQSMSYGRRVDAGFPAPVNVSGFAGTAHVAQDALRANGRLNSNRTIAR